MEEVSALDAAYMTWLQHGIFHDIDQLRSLNVGSKQFSRHANTNEVDNSHDGWKDAVQRLL